MNHCCQEMEANLSDNELHLKYGKKTREYAIAYKEDCGGGFQLIKFCPWCGTKLPKGLSDEFWNIIENELKIETDILDLEDNPLVPTAFKTDEWWKNSGL